jgi:hypothetical protein
VLVFGRDPRELELRLMSLDLWRSMNETIGRDTGFRLSGIATHWPATKRI